MVKKVTKSNSEKKKRKVNSMKKTKKTRNKVVTIETHDEIREKMLARLRAEEERKIPQFNCSTCQHFIDGRCVIRQRAVDASNKCFEHSNYPEGYAASLASEELELATISTIIQIMEVVA